MAVAHQFILGIGLLLLASVLASRISDRLGVPLLLVFLLLGILAGEEGPGGITYNDVFSANLLANLALAVILFDGGLRTPLTVFRLGLRPALGLATVGVLVTAGITGCAASYLFDMSLPEGLLLGAIVGSTDAAAVFSLLHSQGLQLNHRVQATLEIESGSNDPMAVFLTMALIELLASDNGNPGWAMAGEFLWQLSLGIGFGVGGGLLLTLFINRVRLAGSLYPLLAFGGGLTIYASASTLGGSGFLAAYVGGLLVGNRVRRAGNNIMRFHDGMAWLSQIGLFLLLGLLVVPTELLPIGAGALLTALVLIFVARPAAVLLCLLPFRFSWRERVFISWVGLRGAVPIVLGLYPLIAGATEGRFAFNVAFFVVLVSLVVQGWTLAPVARLLRLQMPALGIGRRLAEIEAPGLHGHELVVYRLPPHSPALGRRLDQLELPPSAQAVAVARAGTTLPEPREAVLREGDYLYLLAHPRALPALEDLLGGIANSVEEQQFFGPFVLRAEARLADVGEAYGVNLPAPLHEQTIAGLLRGMHGKVLAVGDRARVGELVFVVRQVQDGRPLQVGLRLLPRGHAPS